MADPIGKLILGLVTGFLFGFLLQKGRVTKYEVIVGQFRLRDFTVLKTMLTAVVVGGTGVYALRALGMATLHVKPALMIAIPVGGVIFGVGMTLLGYCPGTGVAAAAEGRRDAIAGVAGMLLGALLFAECFDWLNRTVLAWSNLGPLTLPQITNLPAWAWIAFLALVAVVLFRGVESLEHRRPLPGRTPSRIAGTRSSGGPG